MHKPTKQQCQKIIKKLKKRLRTYSKKIASFATKKNLKKIYKNHKELILILSGLAVLFLFAIVTNTDELDNKIEMQEKIIETHEEKDEVDNKIIESKDKLIDEAETDIEKLERIKETNEKQIKELEQELQAKETRKANIVLASTSTTSPVVSKAGVAVPNNSSTVPSVASPVATSYNDGNSKAYHDGIGGAWGQCVWGVDNAVGIPSGAGNATDLTYTLPAYGYTNGAPKINSIAVFPAGMPGAHPVYGHVAYVTGINGDNVTIRETNFNGQLGVYSSRVINRYSGVQFLSL